MSDVTQRGSFDRQVRSVHTTAPVVTLPPVTLRCDVAAVYADRLLQLVETDRHLVELIEVYEHNDSGWVSLELSLWQLDPLRAGTFIPLPKGIRDKSAVTNVKGTGDACFKWAVLAGLHPTSDHSNRMESYLVHVYKYDLSTLSYSVPLYHCSVCC